MNSAGARLVYSVRSSGADAQAEQQADDGLPVHVVVEGAERLDDEERQEAPLSAAGRTGCGSTCGSMPGCVVRQPSRRMRVVAAKARASLGSAGSDLLARDRAPADVVAVEFAGPGDAGDLRVGAALRVGHAVAQRADAEHAAAAWSPRGRPRCGCRRGRPWCRRHRARPRLLMTSPSARRVRDSPRAAITTPSAGRGSQSALGVVAAGRRSPLRPGPAGPTAGASSPAAFPDRRSAR